MMRLQRERWINGIQRRLAPQRGSLPVQTGERAVDDMFTMSFRAVRHQVENGSLGVIELEWPQSRVDFQVVAKGGQDPRQLAPETVLKFAEAAAVKLIDDQNGIDVRNAFET